jgi:glycosyltransferase involved in cell wall biosynthesis
MRVAMNAYFWDRPHTGSGQYLHHLWDALAQLPSPPSRTLLLPPGQSHSEHTQPGPNSKLKTMPSSAAKGQNSKLPLLGKSVNVAKLAWEQWSVVRQSRHVRADILHSPYLTAPLRTTGLPVVVTAHDMIPWIVPGYKGSPTVQLYLAISAMGVKRARLIIADSDASRRDVIKVLKVSPGRVFTVYLGMESHPCYTEQQLADVRTRYGLPRDFAFYIGGFDRRKNVPLLLGAWQSALAILSSQWCAPEKPILAIGGAVPQSDGLFPDVRREARQVGLDGAVRFLGRISEEDKPLLMAAARLFIYPSAYEGFGLDPLEAMSVGCPVVSSSGGSLAEVVGGAGLLVPPNDEQALCQAIVRVWTDDVLRAELSSKGKERARLFSWERTAELTAHLYELALTRARR